MIILAKAILYLAAGWLIVVGFIMLTRPRLALDGLRKMASTATINIVELCLRFFVGVAFILYANRAPYPQAFQIIGWFLAVTAILILLIPRQWHARYAVWWADKLPEWLVRALSPVSFTAGGYLAYLVS